MIIMHAVKGMDQRQLETCGGVRKRTSVEEQVTNGGQIKVQMKKGYKVTDKNRNKIVGVACNSLSELLEKGRQKLSIWEDVRAALDDGTIVDDEDYFQALPQQIIITLYRENEDIATGVDFVLNALRRVNYTYLEAGTTAKEALLNKAHELVEILEEKEKADPLKNTREEDPDWFEGLETNSKTKDEFMNRKSQDRIRGYLYKFQEDVRKSKVYLDNSCRKILLDCMEFFKKQLKTDNYFGCYFDRRCAGRKNGSDEVDERTAYLPNKRSRPENLNFEKDEATAEWVSYDKFSYCDGSGNFVCQGKWKANDCEFVREHRINPYASRKARILFSTWNLDHRIERSRTVGPALLEAVKNCQKYQSVNFHYFYLLLFTKTNIKLVHVVCHDKATHDVFCDSKFIYLKVKS